MLVFFVIGCIFPPPRNFRYHLVSSHLPTNHADEQQQVNLLASPLSRRNSYHSSLLLVGSSRHHDIASIQHVADRDTFLLQNNAVVAAHQQQAAYNAAIVEELEIITRAAAAERMRRTRLLLSERNAADQLLQLHANSQLHYRRY